MVLRGKKLGKTLLQSIISLGEARTVLSRRAFLLNAETSSPVEEAPKPEISVEFAGSQGPVPIDDTDATTSQRDEGTASIPPVPPHSDERQVKLDTDRAFVMYPVGAFQMFSLANGK